MTIAVPTDVLAGNPGSAAVIDPPRRSPAVRGYRWPFVVGAIVVFGLVQFGLEAARADYWPHSSPTVGTGTPRPLVPMAQPWPWPSSWRFPLPVGGGSRWCVGSRGAVEANPFVAWAGLPAKVALVTAASAGLARWRPGWLRWLTLVFAAVLAWHLARILAGGA